MELKEYKIELSGLLINYCQAGKGEPIIFLHNGGGFWQSWEKQINYFSNNFTVFGIDWPGFGESNLPNELISLKLLTNILDEFIDQKNLKNVILIGNCIGGSAALNYSQLKPQNVKELIIFNICPGTMIYPFKIARKIIPALNSYSVLKSIVKELFVFAFTKTPVKRKFPKILFGRNFDITSPLSKRYIEKFKLENQTKSRVNLVFSVHTFNIETYITTDKVREHLLVWGCDNKVTSLRKHGYFHKEYLNSVNFKIIEEAGHLCMYEKSFEVNELILKYITRSV